MSQRNVVQVIGQLVTDEMLRHRFVADPRRTLEALAEAGVELTPLEQQALITLDRQLLRRFADAIDPRLQRTAPHGGAQ